MNNSAGKNRLNHCGCCESKIKDIGHSNLPGLTAIKYRVGTYPTFLERMKSQIYKWEVVKCSECGVEFVGPDRAALISDHFNQAHPNIPDTQVATRIRRNFPLEKLSVRTPDDASIAFMDSWAVAADVLTFYQERIANEGFLRTATERCSILEMARSIGYELDPGVSAETYLAFTVDDSPGAPPNALVPKGTKVQSIPAKQDELPQTFETVFDMNAHAAWNSMRPRSKCPQILTYGVNRLYLLGINLNLKRGDLFLCMFEDKENRTVMKVLDIRNDSNNENTCVDLQEVVDPAENQSSTPKDNKNEIKLVEIGAKDDPMQVKLFDDSKINIASMALTQFKTFQTEWPEKDRATIDPNEDKLPLTSENVKNKILEYTWSEEDLQTFLSMHEWDWESALAYIKDLRLSALYGEKDRVLAFDEKLGFFGHNAPLYKSLPKELKKEAYPYDWDGSGSEFHICRDSLTTENYYPGKDDVVYLESTVSGLVGETWAVLENSGSHYQPCKIMHASEVSRTGYNMSTKVTGLKFSQPINQVENYNFRTSRAHVKSKILELAALPITDHLAEGNLQIVLDTMVLGLAKGQYISLTGEEKGSGGLKRSEILKLEEIEHSGGYTRLKFTEGLSYTYLRDTIIINANIVLANHGETISREVLGSGDGTASHQFFTLKKPPLTHVPSSTINKSKSELTVKVDGVEWEQAQSLYGLDGASKNYIVRIDNDANATVIMGDGKMGARLPTGQENVVASYRSGIGSDGEVSGGCLTLLKTRPFGIRSVVNPLKASGADDPEKLENARKNAPLTVLTLDRIVSLQDYEDYARSYPGIGKAQAVTVWDGNSEVVHLTVADANGNKVVSPLYDKLLESIENVRDPLRKVVLDTFQPLVFYVAAKVLFEATYLWDDVKSKIEDLMIKTFSFDRRSFSQVVTAAEVLQVMHSIDAVKAVDLDELYKTTPDSETASGSLFNTVLDVQAARYDKSLNTILPAQLLLIHKQGITLSEIKS